MLHFRVLSGKVPSLQIAPLALHVWDKDLDLPAPHVNLQIALTI
jgi:hypothetical protein